MSDRGNRRTSRSASRRHLSYRLDNLLRMVRLLQHEAVRYRSGRHGREARRIDHRQLRMMLTAVFGDLPAVDLSGQPHIGNQNVGRRPFAPRKRFFAVAGVDDVKAFLA